MTTEHFDVLIIGAGISGIGAGCHLTMKSPKHTFAILEGRGAMGGTWDLFRYPGIRSDSDMFTFGYSFRPWTDKHDIASGEAIRGYLEGTIAEYRLKEKIRFHHRVNKAEWSSEQGQWNLEVMNQETNTSCRMSCSFLLPCTGYYNYAAGYLPQFKGYDAYKGTIAHPQHWPEDLNYTNKRVLIIGSGATAVTLVPSMAQKATHVTMLQRSPTYIYSRPAEDAVAIWLRRCFPKKLAYRLSRIKNVLKATYMLSRSRRKPDKVRRNLRKMTIEAVGPDIDVDTHFRPKYNPWDQRMCVVPDGDLFKALRDRSASIVTDHIDRFTAKGVKLASGKELEADIIVPATGLSLQFLGGMEVLLDGKKIESGDLLSYKGMMFSNIPNFAAVIGFANISWTLKADLTCSYVCRLLNYMKKRGYSSVVPVLAEHPVADKPLLDLKSSYILRATDVIPKQGAKPPWRNRSNYISDLLAVRFGKFNDGVISFR